MMEAEMRRLTFSHVFPLFALIIAATGPSSGYAMITASHLTSEFRTDPLGIDAMQPRLGWVVEGAQRGSFQSAYRVLVSSTAALLAAEKGDLWDTGRMPGDRTTSIRYEGQRLKSHQACFWKVMAWDGNNAPGPWSVPASWSMGILNPDDWHADWIGYDAPRRNEKPAAFASSQWIWCAADKPWNAPAGKRFFVRVLECGAQIVGADLAVTADDSYTLFINGKKAAASPPVPGAWEVPQRQDVSSLLVTGKNILYVEAENVSPGPAGLLFWLRVTYKDGRADTLISDGSWVSSDILNVRWKTDGPGNGEGKPPTSLGNIGTPPWRMLDGSMLVLPPPRHLGTTVSVPKAVRRAVLYATALGLCDVYLNGKRVSDDYFTPGWTDYTKRVYYRSYDVTKLLRKGVNSLGAILADGWYSGHVGWGLQRDHYGAKTRFRAQLHLEYTDGSTGDVGTGPDWKAWTGPTLEADFLMGETFDARLADRSFPTPLVGDPVDVGAEVQPLLQTHPGFPVRSFAELAPKSVSRVSPDRWVFDLGQNVAGVVRLKVRGTPGQKITLRFAERLNPDGTVYTLNLRGARAVDRYVCKGGEEETWEPRFTFHGFQYVEVSGLQVPPAAKTVTGIALSSATPSAGSFECSDPMVNRLQSNIVWTQRANFIDIPTDCPQRDERLGWTGDAQVYVRSACLNADVQAFFHKWIVDLTDAQRADGQFPMVAPLKVAGGDGGPAWADAGVICPWTIYEVYGDRDILEKHYPAMVKFVEFCKGRSTSGLLPPAKFHCFGDWLNINAETPHEIIYAAYLARCTRLVARAAEALGKKSEADHYESLFQKIRAAFDSAYVDAEGHVKGNTQTGYVLALASGLLEGNAAAQAGRHLIADIESRGWHLSTGFVGTKDLMLVLSALGRNDVAYRLLQNETFPSWGFTIRQGATSIWERWDGWTPEKGFQDPGMNSFAHYSFGAVYQWMVENIGGIRSVGPGFRKLAIAPQPGGTLTWARVGYTSAAGPVSTSWKLTGGRMTVNVSIPANASATITLPAVGGAVTESGNPVDRQTGLKLLKEGVFEAGSGTYEFVYPYKNPG
jgi:alpha-L-rhamnosidase